MTNEDLQAIKERAEKATAGPRVLAPELCGPEGQGVYEPDSFGCICEVGDPYPRGNNRPQENMEFIANAREDVPKLVAEVERLRNIIEILEQKSRIPEGNYDYVSVNMLWEVHLLAKEAISND
ncbi:hypothetical protein PZE06_21440 [Robertmurraya sp. DFI.2.37]|uniref:hypothetical protein n=1 Tax=Robertmurraya sp. DFI.2.37 TaxID=3031819 RepID=UPI001243D07E|nr:hypothetical protein [Robertmurraya sp. DFI.2.37]MDF1510703.1 hypothetical protein [Robertmurraya sp. DFI.2.37]